MATIPLSGKPEFAVFDPAADRIYNNIDDQNEIAVIDASSHSHKVMASWRSRREKRHPVSPSTWRAARAVREP